MYKEGASFKILTYYISLFQQMVEKTSSYFCVCVFIQIIWIT